MISREDHEEEFNGATATFQYNRAGDPSRIEISGDSLHLAAAQLGLPQVTFLEFATSYVISYEYDAEGKLVADTLHGENPELGYNIESRKLDAHGNVTRLEGRLLQYGSGNEEQLTLREYRYEYNGDGLVARQLIDQDGDGKTDEIADHSYDQHGAEDVAPKHHDDCRMIDDRRCKDGECGGG